MGPSSNAAAVAAADGWPAWRGSEVALSSIAASGARMAAG